MPTSIFWSLFPKCWRLYINWNNHRNFCDEQLKDELQALVAFIWKLQICFWELTILTISSKSLNVQKYLYLLVGSCGPICARPMIHVHSVNVCRFPSYLSHIYIYILFNLVVKFTFSDEWWNYWAAIIGKGMTSPYPSVFPAHLMRLIVNQNQLVFGSILIKHVFQFFFESIDPHILY